MRKLVGSYIEFAVTDRDTIAGHCHPICVQHRLFGDERVDGHISGDSVGDVHAYSMEPARTAGALPLQTAASRQASACSLTLSLAIETTYALEWDYPYAGARRSTFPRAAGFSRQL
jgi:hypothetical protein